MLLVHMFKLMGKKIFTILRAFIYIYECDAASASINPYTEIVVKRR